MNHKKDPVIIGTNSGAYEICSNQIMYFGLQKLSYAPHFDNTSTHMTSNPSSPFPVGRTVFLEDLKRRAQIVEGPNKKGEYFVALGGMNVWVHAKQLKLEPSEKKKKENKSKNLEREHFDFQKSSRAKNEEEVTIDLHGQTVQEALDALEKAIDRALLAHASGLKVIHGLGKGKLSAAVRQFLSRCRHIKRIVVDEGNPGVTRAFL